MRSFGSLIWVNLFVTTQPLKLEQKNNEDTTQTVVARLELGTDKRMPSLMLIVRLLKAANAHLELKCIFDKVA